MDADKLRELLVAVQQGGVDVEAALARLRTLPFDDLEDYARLDVHRALRNGMPEVVFCESKTAAQAAAILGRLWAHHDRVLGSRVSPEMAQVIQAEIPEAVYDPVSRLVTLSRAELPAPAADAPYVMVVCGGTSDLPVAEEAAQVLAFLGHRVERAYDVGVAGLHRILGEIDRLMNATVIISIAGMEGALTSVVAGLAPAPVIGVPTSVGYGVNFGGVAPLLTMLNSCASGVSVVNIDNGYGAAVFAHLMLRQMDGKASKR
ncbi:MAG: nickel pincer cofactor biosynthesis protein LarB [Anaerolineae bacterium]|nr:nickel pincer cofactor biosynthesis protein LarB [Anaerolineae bacterium]